MKIDIDSFETQLPGYFTASEAAQVLGYVDQSYISRLIRAGKVKAYKVGPCWLISNMQMKILLNQGKTKGNLNQGKTKDNFNKKRDTIILTVLNLLYISPFIIFLFSNIK